ncbi:MAG: hypothetical protein ABI811_00440 [Acidobacteriota bacterium]
MRFALVIVLAAAAKLRSLTDGFGVIADKVTNDSAGRFVIKNVLFTRHVIALKPHFGTTYVRALRYETCNSDPCFGWRFGGRAAGANC